MESPEGVCSGRVRFCADTGSRTGTKANPRGSSHCRARVNASELRRHARYGTVDALFGRPSVAHCTSWARRSQGTRFPASINAQTFSDSTELVTTSVGECLVDRPFRPRLSPSIPSWTSSVNC